MKKALLIILLVSLAGYLYAIQVGGTGANNGINVNGPITGNDTLTIGAYTRYIDVEAGGAVLGPTAPSIDTIGTFTGLAFDADAEMVGISFEVPDDWVGTSDMTFKIYWTNEAGDALADTETVIWTADYRCIDFDNSEDIESGTAVTITGTYTQSGAGGDGDTHKEEIALDYDHGDQPLTKGTVCGFAFSRDMTTDTYGGDAVVMRWEIEMSSNTMPQH